MQKVFSTADVHPRDGFDYWHEVLCREILEHECVPERRQPFRGELYAGKLADIDLGVFESTPMHCAATTRHIAHTNSDFFFVLQPIFGVIVLHEDGRESLLTPGDFALLDARRPMAGEHL